MRNILFFCLFLPMGYRYSVDQVLREWKGESINEGNPVNPNFSILNPFKKFNERDNNFFNAATIGFYMQIFYLYFFSVFFKNGDAWVKTYTATEYALSL